MAVAVLHMGHLGDFKWLWLSYIWDVWVILNAILYLGRTDGRTPEVKERMLPYLT